MTPAALLSWRRSRTYTQRQAAEKLGVALRSYLYWEKGRRAIPPYVVNLVAWMPG